MCGTFYKYFLITSTSFMASSGLYFVCLTRWLWPSPIYDYSEYDWRKVPQALGAICLVLFSIGLLVVLRARIRELVVFFILLNLPFMAIIVVLTVQLVTKDVIFDLSDIFLIVVISLFVAIMANIFLFIRSIQSNVRKESKQMDDFL